MKPVILKTGKSVFSILIASLVALTLFISIEKIIVTEDEIIQNVSTTKSEFTFWKGLQKIQKSEKEILKDRDRFISNERVFGFSLLILGLGGIMFLSFIPFLLIDIQELNLARGNKLINYFNKNETTEDLINE